MSSQTLDLAPEDIELPLPTIKPSAKARLLYIDNLRILLTALVILHHLAIGYGSFGLWYYNEGGTMSEVGEILMTLFLGINQSFFMGFFFLISSYFSPGSVDRKGAGTYLKDRLIRLGIPLLFYIFILAPIVNFAVRRNVWRFNSSLLQTFWTSSLNYINSYPEIGIDVGPLWFIEVLLAFSVLYGIWRLVAKPTSNQSFPETQSPSNLAIALFALGVGLVTFTVRIWLPVGWEFRLLHLQFPHFPQYLAMLIVGILAYRRNWFTGITDSMGRFWSLAVITLVVFFPVLFLFEDGFESNLRLMVGGLHWQALAYAVWEQFMCVAMVTSLIVGFRNRINDQGTFAQALSAAAYATYIFHAPVIVLLAKCLRGVRMDLALKFLWVAPLALVLSFTVGFLVKKLPLARKIL